MNNISRATFAWLLLLFCNSILSLPISFGTKCALRSVQSGLFLAATSLPVSFLDPDKSEEFLSFAPVYLASSNIFDCHWFIKKEHLDNERWNFKEVTGLKNNSTVRLESCLTGGNLSADFSSQKVTIGTAFKFTFGLGCSSNSSNLKIMVVKVGPQEVQPDSQITTESVLYIALSALGRDDQLLIADKEKRQFYFKSIKDCKPEDLLNAQWAIDPVSPDYFVSEYLKPLETQVKLFDQNSKFSKLNTGNVVEISAKSLVGDKEGGFLFSEIRVPDLAGYIGVYSSQAKKSGKALTRLNQVCFQSATSAWAVSNTFKLVRIEMAADRGFSELVTELTVHGLSASQTTIFVLVDGQVFELLNADGPAEGIKISPEPILKDVLSFCVAPSGDLFFIDSKYSIFKRSKEKSIVKIYQHNPSAFPPFCKLATDDGKVLLATRADGKLFVIKNDYKTFVYSGLDFVLSAALARDKVVFASQSPTIQGGPCQAIELKELEKLGGNKLLLTKIQVKNLKPLWEAVEYFSGLYFKDPQGMEDLLVWLESRVGDFAKEKNSKEAKDFNLYFKSSFVPTASLLPLSGVAKSAMTKVDNFFAPKVVSDGELKSRVESLEKENKVLRETLKRAGEIVTKSSIAKTGKVDAVLPNS